MAVLAAAGGFVALGVIFMRERAEVLLQIVAGGPTLVWLSMTGQDHNREAHEGRPASRRGRRVAGGTAGS